MGNIKRTLTIGIGLAVKLFAGLVAVKLCAEYLGAEDFWITGQLSSLLSIVTLLAGAGVSVGVTKVYAGKELVAQARRAWTRSARSIAFLSSGILLIAIVCSSELIVEHLFLDAHGAWWLIGALAISVFPIASFGVEQGKINGMHRDELYAISLVLGSILGLVGLWVAANYFGAIGVLVGMIWLPVAQAFSMGIIGRSIKDFDKSQSVATGLTKEHAKFFLGYGLLYIAPGIVIPAAYLVIRLLIQEHNGFEVLGFWQAALRLSDAYCQLPMLMLSVVLFPKIASLDASVNPSEIVKNIYAYITVLTVGIVLAVYFSYGIWINIIFTPNFNGMKEYMPYQMVGDVLRIASYIGTTALAARGKVKLCLCAELIQALLLVSLSAALISSSNSFGACYAYIITYSIYLLLTIFLFKVEWKEEVVK